MLATGSCACGQQAIDPTNWIRNTRTEILVTSSTAMSGAHAARLLDRAGRDFDLITFRKGIRMMPVGPVDRGAVRRPAAVEVLQATRIEAVMHFAALRSVGESVTDPAKYYQNNVVATLNLLDAMRHGRVKRIVFSSTTATYWRSRSRSDHRRGKATADQSLRLCKLVIEHALADYAQPTDLLSTGVRATSMPPAPAHGRPGEDHDPETHLIPSCSPRARSAAGDHDLRRRLSYARRHVHPRLHPRRRSGRRARETLDGSRPARNCDQLGTGHGYSVRQVIDACRDVSGKPIPQDVREPPGGRSASWSPIRPALSGQYCDWQPVFK